MTSKGAILLFNTLKDCKAVVSRLDLQCNQLDYSCIEALGSYFRQNQYLETLILTQNMINNKGIEILSENLIGNTTIKEIKLAKNADITSETAQLLQDAVKESYITSIDVSSLRLPDNFSSEIARYLLIPIDDREIHVKSNSKSAAKRS